MRKGWLFLGFVLLAVGVALGMGALAARGTAPTTALGTGSAPATRVDNSRLHAQNLKAIGQAMAIYAAEYNDRLPPTMDLTVRSLETIPMSTGNSMQILTGPDVKMPAEVANAPVADRAAWLAKNGGYLFLHPGSRFSSAPNASKAPLVIERPDADPTKPQLAVLYYDGHVEQRDRAEVEAMLPKPATTTKP